MKEQKPVSPVSVEHPRAASGAPEDNVAKRAWGDPKPGDAKPVDPKLVESRPAEPMPLRSGMERKPSRSSPTMQTSDAQSNAKNRGRLSRDVLSKLGKTLEDYFDDVRKQGVPDRFKDLLAQFDDPEHKGSRE